MEGFDGSVIDHNSCLTQLKIGVKGIIYQKGTTDTILVMKDARGFFLPIEFMTTPTVFVNTATRLLAPFGVNQLNVSGFLQLKHQAPPDPKTPGYLIAIFQSEVDEKTVWTASSNISVEWKALSQLMTSSELINEDKQFLATLKSLQLVSPKIFRFEQEGIA